MRVRNVKSNGPAPHKVGVSAESVMRYCVSDCPGAPCSACTSAGASTSATKSAYAGELVICATAARTRLELRHRERERALRHDLVAAGVAGDVTDRHVERVELERRQIDGLADRVIVRSVGGLAEKIEPGDHQRRARRRRLVRH